MQQNLLKIYILLCLALYHVQHITVSKKYCGCTYLNVHLFNFLMSTCCSHNMLPLQSISDFILFLDPTEIKLLYLRYLLRYNKMDKLLSWIQESGEKQTPILHQLLEHIDECTSYVRYMVMESCAR